VSAKKGSSGRRKPGCYARSLDAPDRRKLKQAAEVEEGLEEEIALLRVQIQKLVEADPPNVRLIIQAANALSRLMIVNHRIARDQKKGMKTIVGDVLKDLAVPVGTGLGTSLLRK